VIKEGSILHSAKMKSLNQLTDRILDITESEKGDTPPLYILPSNWQPPEEFGILLKEIVEHPSFFCEVRKNL
jgi:hypothetical protein